MASDTSQFGYGFQDPTDSSDQFNLISFICRQLIQRIDTMKLVKVVAVTGGGVDQPPGTVDVLPLVNQVDGAGNAQPHGTVHGIPWTRWQAGLNALVMDPAVDDIGWVVCADRDISVVKENGKQANPGSNRSYDLADGVYVGGVLNATPDQYLALLATGFDFKDRNGNRLQTSNGATSIAIASHGDMSINANSGAGKLAVNGGGTFTGALEAKTFNVNNGSGTVTRVLTANASPVFGTLNGGTAVTATATVTGAKVGDLAIISRASTGAPGPLLTLDAYVSAADTVTIRCLNSINGSVIASVNGTYSILVIGLTP